MPTLKFTENMLSKLLFYYLYTALVKLKRRWIRRDSTTKFCSFAGEAELFITINANCYKIAVK